MSQDKFSGVNILKKILATIRTESQELKEAVMDSGGSGKLQQSFDDAKFKLNEAKQALNQMMIKKKKSVNVLEITQEKIAQKELLIAQELSNKDKAQLMDFADQVVDLEHAKALQLETFKEINSHISYLQKQLEISERELKEFGRQLSMLKTTENIQKATETIVRNIEGADNNILSANQSLNRIRKKQKNKSEKLKMPHNKELNTHQIEGKTDVTFRQELTPTAQDIIERIKQKD